MKGRISLPVLGSSICSASCIAGDNRSAGSRYCVKIDSVTLDDLVAIIMATGGGLVLLCCTWGSF